MRRALSHAGMSAALALLCGCDHAGLAAVAPTGAIVGSA